MPPRRNPAAGAVVKSTVGTKSTGNYRGGTYANPVGIDFDGNHIRAKYISNSGGRLTSDMYDSETGLKVGTTTVNIREAQNSEAIKHFSGYLSNDNNNQLGNMIALNMLTNGCGGGFGMNFGGMPFQQFPFVRQTTTSTQNQSQTQNKDQTKSEKLAKIKKLLDW